MLSSNGIIELALSCAWLAVVVSLIVRAFNQRNLFRPLAESQLPISDNAPTVAIIIPVRNEEENIASCLRSLTTQYYPKERLHILVVDDHSSDRTVCIAEALARNQPQLGVIRTPALPPGWVGKSHACWVGAHTAPIEAEWLCFLDADVQAKPKLLASATLTATAERLELLSLSPRQQLGSFAERLVMPCGLYILAFCQDLRKIQSDQADAASATGQFMLIRRSAYEAAGGHAAIRAAVCEDVALARLLKKKGGRVVLYDGRQLITTRMYTGWRALWLGFAKNLVDMLGGEASTLRTALAAVVLAWAACAVPVIAGLSCGAGSSAGCLALAPALAGSAAALGLHIAGAAYFGIPLWYGLLFPLGYTVGSLMALDSLRRRRTGRVTWKGRTYP